MTPSKEGHERKNSQMQMASKFHCTIMDMNNPKNETWKKDVR